MGAAGVEIKNQAILIGCDRQQAKDLRQNRALEVEDQAHHIGTELTNADPGNIGVTRHDLAHQVFKGGEQRHVLDVDGQSGRVWHECLGELKRNVGLDGDATVIG